MRRVGCVAGKLMHIVVVNMAGCGMYLCPRGGM